MASITIKNIPEDLHRRLKDMARRGGRSLNQEILQQLRASLSAVRRPEDLKKQFERLDRLHEEMLANGYQPPTPDEIVRRIREDRASH